MSAATDAKRRAHDHGRWPKGRGLAQLSLVEHALCPLDDRMSLVRGLTFDTGYFRTNQSGQAQFIPVEIRALEGLSANDEFYLWGLLALTFAQSDPTIELWATPHWCLRSLGCIGGSKGGVNYTQFREALRRLAGVTYYCDRFYDPLRKEERRRAFGFLKYDLPASDDSTRAWRIVWDPLFFEYCVVRGGKLSFDLVTYRQLDCASRRLFLLLTKIFWRRPVSPRFDVWHLGVHGLGFAPQLHMRDLKIKLVRAVEKLVALGIVSVPTGTTRVQDLFEKKGVGSYALRLQRGPYFERSPTIEVPARTVPRDSPLADPLRAIGFDDAAISRLLSKYSERLLRLWADITLAKLERDGPAGFSNCPQAYFLDNVKQAAAGLRTPPDWWQTLQKEQRRKDWEARHAEVQAALEEHRTAWEQVKAAAFKQYVKNEVGAEAYEQSVQRCLAMFRGTMPEKIALENAIRETERHFRAGFQFPDLADWVVQNASENLRHNAA